MHMLRNILAGVSSLYRDIIEKDRSKLTIEDEVKIEADECQGVSSSPPVKRKMLSSWSCLQTIVSNKYSKHCQWIQKTYGDYL